MLRFSKQKVYNLMVSIHPIESSDTPHANLSARRDAGDNCARIFLAGQNNRTRVGTLFWTGSRQRSLYLQTVFLIDVSFLRVVESGAEWHSFVGAG